MGNGGLKVLGICGSLRPDSAHARVLEQCLVYFPEDVQCRTLQALENVPIFYEGREPSPEVEDMQAQLAWADALIFAVPEFIHAMPAGIKNLFEWTVGSGELGGKPAVVFTAYTRSTFVVSQVVEVLRTMEARVLESVTGPLGLAGRSASLPEDKLRAIVKAILEAGS